MHRHTRAIRRAGAAAMATAVAIVGATARGTAHVDYVTDSNGGVDAVSILLRVLSKPLYVGLLAAGALGVVVVAVGYLRYRPARRDVAVFRETMTDYRSLLPWLFRLSIGLPLVGAGFSGYFFSPVVPPLAPGPAVSTRLFQIGLGFLLLFGLATRLAAVVGLVTYLVALPFAPGLWLAAEFVPGFVALALLGSGTPSADHVLHTVASAEGTVYGTVDPVHRVAAWVDRLVDPYEAYVPTVVRVGLGLNFALLGVGEKLLDPGPALAVVSKYGLTAVVPVDPGLWVVGAGLTELALGMALVFGVFTRASAMVALGTFTLTLFALPDDPVLAHVSLFGLASALVVTGSGPLSLDRYLLAHVEGAVGAPATSPGGD